MDITSHLLHSSQDTLAGLSLTFKRYQPHATKRSGATRVALVLAHCVGTHKETWVPVIEYLYQFQSQTNSVVIAEAWSMDSPNHGATAAIDENAFLNRPQEMNQVWESREVARAWLAKRLPWKRWDSRILDAFVVRHVAGSEVSLTLKVNSNMGFGIFRQPRPYDVSMHP
ncbi:hypothetical protein DFH08DRAFT_1087826 [Mycena albidolilacea]|uniref:Uncharacterized protein n=1 Tax=Mycena albidolilacea TaxID=1033008 RepID=A0AAD7ECC0_9AGAR|nr:hypothetical protein DFH08DRAFT_1087826 [Mycena albidolilacea]